MEHTHTTEPPQITKSSNLTTKTPQNEGKEYIFVIFALRLVTEQILRVSGDFEKIVLFCLGGGPVNPSSEPKMTANGAKRFGSLTNKPSFLSSAPRQMAMRKKCKVDCSIKTLTELEM
jgi:hypothetical protein